tara:strand:- start:115 stop:1218 length:1104 start_codon:yes stop_codon:yes gene_type:complete
MNISIATIPPRVRDGSLIRCVNSLLIQSIKIKKIYVNLPNKFKRFEQLTETEIKIIEDYDEKIKVTYTNYDSPALKYIGALKHIENDDEYIFIGDDDQEYHKDLLKKMREGCYKDNAVYQNRYNIVKKGTAGIIHGFVGLMTQKKVFNNLDNFKFPKECWIDDQLFNIYFFLNNIEILPSPIHEFQDIYRKLNNNNQEQIGEGALCMMPKKRSIQIRELEELYGVFFLKKNKPDSQGKLKKVDWKKLYDTEINIHYVLLDTTTKAIKENIRRINKSYPDFKYHFHDQKEFFKDYPNFKFYTIHSLNYRTDKYGLELIKRKKGTHIYINRNMRIDPTFDIYEYLLNEETIYFNCENILIIKNNHNNNI